MREDMLLTLHVIHYSKMQETCADHPAIQPHAMDAILSHSQA